jgi:hypothetical protein
MTPDDTALEAVLGGAATESVVTVISSNDKTPLSSTKDG